MKRIKIRFQLFKDPRREAPEVHRHRRIAGVDGTVAVGLDVADLSVGTGLELEGLHDLVKPAVRHMANTARDRAVLAYGVAQAVADHRRSARPGKR